MKKFDVIHCYDGLAACGGAEKVALAIAKLEQPTQIVFGTKVERACKFVGEIPPNARFLFKNATPGLITNLLVLLRFAALGITSSNKQTLVVSGIYAMSAALFWKGPIIHYCHTIPRFAYDLNAYYTEQMAWYKKVLFKAYCWFVKRFYSHCACKATLTLVNSKNTQNRLEKYLGIKAEVLYPPADIDRHKRDYGFGTYFLSTARLEPFKRVRVILEAFRKLPKVKLIVLSEGSEYKELTEEYTQPNIVFTGYVSDEQKNKYLRDCIATIYVPIDEDFGLSPLESLSFGKPVIGVDEGGVRETVIDGIHGFLCPSSDLESSIQASVNNILSDKEKFNREILKDWASEFETAPFLKALSNKIKSVTE